MPQPSAPTAAAAPGRPATAPAPAVRPFPEACHLPLALVDPTPDQPRRALAGIEDLAAHVRQHGLLQPVVVTPAAGGRYTLVAGHRRLAALQTLAAAEPGEARWREVEAVVRHADEGEAYLLTLTENLQRSDLSPREEVAALEVLVRQEGWSVRRVAAAIHRDPAYVSRRLRVFDDPVLAGPVLSNDLAVTTAQELLRVDPDQRAAMVDQALAGAWNAHETRRAVKERCESQRAGVGDELLMHLRAAGALLASAKVGMLSEEKRADARRLLRRLGRALRESVTTHNVERQAR
jgi:ParB/RepB/Spo0J family partition protein